MTHMFCSFVRLCRKYKLMAFELGPPANKNKLDNTAREVFIVLNGEWNKVLATSLSTSTSTSTSTSPLPLSLCLHR